MLTNKLISTNYFKNILFIIIGIFVPFVINSFTPIGIKESYFILFIFALSSLLFYYSIYRIQYKPFINKIILGLIIYLSMYFSYKIILTYNFIPQWDFLCFYLFGKVGISNSNFYDPIIFSKYFNALNLYSMVGDNYIKEIVEVGFWYPPPSMFLFLGLGLFKVKTAYFIWQSIIIIFLLLDIFLLIKFFNNYKVSNDGYLKSTFPLILLILFFPNIIASILYSQTVVLFLFFLILTIKYIDSWKTGFFLAILIIIKPLAAVFVLYFILLKKWKIFFTLIISGIVIIIATGLYFGFDTFITYLTSPPTLRIPEYVYLESSSIYANVIKLQNRNPLLIPENSIKFIYYLLSTILILITLFATRKINNIKGKNIFMAFIPLALIIYPGTLGHYIIMLLPVILYIYASQSSKNPLLNWILLFFFYIIGFYSFSLLNLILWAFLILSDLNLKYNFINFFPENYAGRLKIILK